jgi:hypothetical protein
VHPYVTQLIAEQRIADMHAAAAAHRLARAAKASSGTQPRRPGRRAAAQRSAPASGPAAAVQLYPHRVPGRSDGGPDSRARLAGPDEHDAELCATARR